METFIIQKQRIKEATRYCYPIIMHTRMTGDYIRMNHKSEPDFSSLGGANCLLRRERGSRAALCGG